MTVAAWGRKMAASEGETDLLVSSQGECGRNEPVQIVALLAAVFIRIAGELRIVLIFMAVSALRKRKFVERVFAFGQMALGTFERRVLAFERIGRLLMSFHIE